MCPDRRLKENSEAISNVPDGSHLTRQEYAALERQYLAERGPFTGDGMFAYMKWVLPLVEYLNRHLNEKGVTVEPPPKSSAYPAKDYKAWG